MLCYYDGILKSEVEDPLYIGSYRRVVLLHIDVAFNEFES